VRITAALNDPTDVVSQLLKADFVQVVVQTDKYADAEWQLGAYEQFLRSDSEEDAIYELFRQ